MVIFLSLAPSTVPDAEEALCKHLLNDLSTMSDTADKKTKIPFVHVTVYIHFFVVLIQLSFGLKRSSFYLFIVHHFFRFGQSFSPDKMVFFYLLFKSLSLFSKEYFASSNCIISNMYYPAINFFIQVINNNSGQDILHDIYLLLLRITVIPSLVLLTGLQTPQERHHSSLIFIFP